MSTRPGASTSGAARRAAPERPQRGDGTSALLVEAAACEFNERGFDGTDTNRIARRAGFSPQTFYRWFRDKTEIFLAVYRVWEEEEYKVLEPLIAQRAPAARLVEAAVQHHRAHLRFRRSLRLLALEDPEVRRARAASRLRQMERVRHRQGSGSTADIATTMLQVERLCDALAEGEFSDLGVDEAAPRAKLAELMVGLLVRG
jgi:AcrR family transcriptional regulator